MRVVCIQLCSSLRCSIASKNVIASPKKIFFSLLHVYPYDIRGHSCVKNQVRTRKVTDARLLIVSIRYVGDNEVRLNDCGTTGSAFEVPSNSFSSFLHDCMHRGWLKAKPSSRAVF